MAKSYDPKATTDATSHVTMFDWTGFGTTLLGLSAFVTSVTQLRFRKTVKHIDETTQATRHAAEAILPKVTAVHDEVATTNGIPVGEMLERQEGRRIQGLPVDDRTPSEQEYVTKLVAGGRDRGHET